MTIYVVKSGDTIYSIARNNGVTPQSIIDANELAFPSQLTVGQSLVIIPQNIVHVVKPGDTIYAIAKKYGVTMADILLANPTIADGNKIYPGQGINVPVREAKLGTIEVNGYAYPGTNMEVLRKTFPYLTYLSIFSYTINADGSLNTINDVPLITAARNAKVAPIMVITNIEEGGGFNSELAHSVLTNESAQTILINNIVAILRAKNYYGLNVDFEYVFQNDKTNYNNFMRRLTARLHSLGYFVMTSLAPKYSATQVGLLYEAHDYPVHGALVNRVILMTYEWGYSGGPPLPVAPLNEVQKVLNYAVSAIPRRKILMGIPNYGYDWTLPFVRGTRAETISNVEAVNRAFNVRTSIRFDTTAQSPYYNYFDSGGKEHIVWFEDARSIRSKLRVVNQYGLAGVSYWTLGRYFPQNWLILNSMYNVKKVL